MMRMTTTPVVDRQKERKWKGGTRGRSLSLRNNEWSRLPRAGHVAVASPAVSHLLSTQTMATKQNDDDDRAAYLLSPELKLDYKPPHSALRLFFWRWRMWFECTFALSMFEGWEKILVGAFPPPVRKDVTLRFW